MDREMAEVSLKQGYPKWAQSIIDFPVHSADAPSCNAFAFNFCEAVDSF